MERRQFVIGALVGAVGGAALTGTTLAVLPETDPGESPAARPVPPPPEGPNRLSYSAMGEDLIVVSLLRDILKLERPTYLDIGAADPVAVNNTYLLRTLGSRGVLVEPNPFYVERLRSKRPEDVVVAAGVGVGEVAEADYYVIRGKPMLNTFDRATAERRTRQGDSIEEVVKMPLVPVMRIIDEHLHAAPDLLSIDAEGMDLDIVKSLDLNQYRPPVICAETKGPTITHESTELAKYLGRRDYIVTAGTLYNTILVDRRRL